MPYVNSKITKEDVRNAKSKKLIQVVTQLKGDILHKNLATTELTIE